jgi:hypothetical protein
MSKSGGVEQKEWQVEQFRAPTCRKDATRSNVDYWSDRSMVDAWTRNLVQKREGDWTKEAEYLNLAKGRCGCACYSGYITEIIVDAQAQDRDGD